MNVFALYTVADTVRTGKFVFSTRVVGKRGLRGRALASAIAVHDVGRIDARSLQRRVD